MSRDPQVDLRYWTDGWLVLETASVLRDPAYILRTEGERAGLGQPASRDERIDFVRRDRGTPCESS